jgi:ubiquinone/menaquinone biosynthesis C-methylase UbiE
MAAGTSSPTASRKLDRWADWLVHGRQRGATDAQVRRLHRGLAKVRDRVLREARLRTGERVVDIGAGTGLLALEARRRVKRSGYVLALDISVDALAECRRRADAADSGAALGYAAADALRLPLASGSVDVVTTRSVLIYLDDKAAGVRELCRVLKPGGRASIFEPINELGDQVARRVRATGFYEPLQPEWGEIRAYYDAHKQEWWGTLVGWDERDLIGWFEAAGFSSVKLSYEYTAGIRPRPPKKADIAAGLSARPNPNQPSYEEVAREVLGVRADAYLARVARFTASSRGARSGSAFVYLVAKR